MSLLFTIFPHVVWALYFLYRITTANPFAPKLPAQHPSFSILKLVILGFLPLPVFFLIATFSLPLLVSYTVAALLALRHTLSAPLLNFVDHLSHRHYLRLLLWRIDVLAYVLYISVTSFFSSPSFLLLLYSSFLFFGSCITSLTDLYARSRHEAPDQTLATMIRLAFVRAPSLPYSPLAPANIRDASAFSLLTFEWVTPTVATGRRRSLEIEDVKSLSQKFSCYAASNDRFVPSWREELDSRHRRDPSLFRALFKAFGLRLMIGGSLKLVNDVAIFIAPMTLRVIIQHLQDRENGLAGPMKGVYLSFVLLGTYIIQSLVFHQYFNVISTVQVLLRGSLVTAVFEKTCRLSPESRALYTSGQIQNLMSTDSRTVADVVLYIHMLWSSVEQIIVSMFLLVSLLGWFATLAGVSFIILSIPLQAVLVSAIKRLREAASYRTDERVKLVSEAIKGIKLVKLYAWELSFVKRILEARSEELNYLRKMAFVQAWNSMLVSSLPTALTIVAFTAFAATGKPLDAAVVFPAIALFNVIRPPLLILPNILINSARAAASLSRLRKFLAADELVPLNEGEHAVNQEVMEQNSLDIVATNASFTWDRSISVAPPTLSSVSFQIPEGSLVAVVGGTGGGKSTLLAGVLGEIPIVSGQAGIRQGRTMSFCDQVPFIRNATVRDNILFGKPFDIDRYKEAIRVCCLLSDLKILPAGDLTEIGGRGVNLSGGQRARVSLARAVYADADICLLDDPLCAVDAHVGKAIFNDCIVSALRGKTRLLTTNQVHFAASHEVDMVMVVHGGTVVEAGNRSELLSNPYSEFARMLEAAGEMGAGEVPSTAVENAEASGIEAEEDADEIGVVIAARAEKTGSSDAKTDAPDYGSIEAGKLTRKETKKKGRVNLKHYATYLSSMGWRQWVLPLVLCGFLSQSFSLSVNVWLSIWSDEKETSNTMFNLIVFLILGVSSVLVTGALAFALACGTIRASVLMHEKLLLSVFGAPSSFFNSTPEGRLVNRFNSDMDKVDQTLGSTLLSLQRLSLSLTFTLGLILWVTPLVVVLVLPVAFICIYIQEFYRKSSVDLRRLEAVARSPLYSHFGETLDGVVTIRAYGDVPRAVNTNNTYTDLLNKTTYASAYANRWLGLRLEALGMTLIFGVTTLAVLTPPGKSSASMIGLVLSYTMQILGVMTWSVRQFTETESQLSAVERVSEYSEPPFPQEEAGGLESFMKEQQELNASMTRTNSAGLISEERMQQLNSGVAHRRHRWPRKGQIDFDRVVMRYREDLPAALREVSFSIRPGEHVGIVGRTGAGKSSAIQSLFRLYELNGGRILIDGVDISSMKLFDLRSSLGVIPQEPVCFSGTIRTNLDMFREHDEDDVQRALDACGLQDTMREKISLDFEVAENGSNLSVGQRQLLCLGRAILKDSQVLVLDEATSSVSNETDQKFQHTLREEMHHCTILTVAHRLHTVMRNDRIIVMDKGMVAEIGKPSELLSGPSRLSALVDETGPATAAHLRNLASIPRGERFADLPGSEQYTNGRRENGVLINGRSGTDDDVSLREQVQAAFLELRTALTDIDSPSWRSELLTAGVEGSQWRGQLRTMVSKLSVLSENLSPPVESDMNGTVESYVAVVPNLSSDMIAEVLQDASPGVGLRKRGKNRSDDDLNENGFVDEKASSRKQ